MLPACQQHAIKQNKSCVILHVFHILRATSAFLATPDCLTYEGYTYVAVYAAAADDIRVASMHNSFPAVLPTILVQRCHELSGTMRCLLVHVALTS